MTPLVSLVTDILSALTVLSDVLIVILILVFIGRRLGFRTGGAAVKFFGSRATLLSFIVALASMLSSLFYSEVADFAPCLLCWWQRIFLYPQVFLLGLALKKKNENTSADAILLSTIGGVIAAYNVFLQFGGSPLLPCSASGLAASCSQRFFLEYGYVTIPTMSLTAFAFIIVLMAAKRAVKNEVV